jgi:hypothetical protein
MRIRRALVLVTTLIAGLTVAMVNAPSASAATITSPAGNPYVVPGDASGQPQSFTVTASGFAANTPVFIEQCDGVSATDAGWDVTQNCDLGSSPAPATSNASGVVTFPANDPNFGFRPFKGFSPQGLFNCLSPSDPSPNNGLTDYRNCKIRVSTNNSSATTDQVFLNIQLPNAVTTAPGFTGTPSGATVGQAYSFAFTSTGSPAPTFTMSPTTVAGGITITTAGVLHGTPTTAGSFPITVTATNGVNPDAVRNLTLAVAPGATPTAMVTCGATGSLSFAKPLSDVPPKKPKTTKVKGSGLFGTGAGATCSSNGVPAGTLKYPVASGQIKPIKGTIAAGASCSTLSTLPLSGTLVTLKWKGVNPKNGKLSNAGSKTLATVTGVTKSDPGTYVLTGSVTTGPFAGKTLRLTLKTDQTHAARMAQCHASGTPSIAFSGAGGASTLEII